MFGIELSRPGIAEYGFIIQVDELGIEELDIADLLKAKGTIGLICHELSGIEELSLRSPEQAGGRINLYDTIPVAEYFLQLNRSGVLRVRQQIFYTVILPERLVGIHRLTRYGQLLAEGRD